MTIPELKSAFLYAYSKEVEVIYFTSSNANLICEHFQNDTDSDITSDLSLGIYFLLSRNNHNCIKFWSLNEPEAISINICELTVPLKSTWLKYPVSVFVQFIKLGVKINHGYNILIWGNIPNGNDLSSVAMLESITAYALSDQLGSVLNKTILGQHALKPE